jgi:hypothetical protein
LGHKPFHFPGDDESGTEDPRLLIATLHQFGATQSPGEAEIVPDQGTSPGLATNSLALHDDGPDTFGGGINGCPEASGSGSDDQQIEIMINISQSRGDPPGFKDFGIRWVHQRGAANSWHPYHDLTLRVPNVIESTLTELGGTVAKGVRDAVPVQQVAYRVRSATVLRRDHDNLTKVRRLAA